MSGATALAAARRRRANASMQQNPIASNSMQNNANEITGTNVDQSEKTKITPTRMLLNHNKMIENINTIIEAMTKQMDSMINEQQIKLLVEETITQELNKIKLDEKNIDFFKNKYSKIENQLSEIKKHVLKIQSFAMETNLQCVELKKKMMRDNKEKKQSFDQMIRSTEHKLEVSQESRDEHIKMLEENTKINHTLNESEIKNDANNEIV